MKGCVPPVLGCQDLRGFEWHYWNRLAHSYQMSLGGHADGIKTVAFSADGKRLASVQSVAFSADGKRLASASTDGTFKVLDAMDGQETVVLKGQKTGGVTSGAFFGTDGSRLAPGFDDPYSGFDDSYKVLVWDAIRSHDTLTLSEPVRERALQIVRQ